MIYRCPLLVSVIAVALVGSFVLIGCSDETPTGVQRPQTPNFELEDLEGETFRLSDYQGKVVLMQFFAEWCHVCQEETATLNALHENLADDGLVVVGISVESGEENVRSFVEEYDVDYRVLYDGQAVVAPAYRVQRTPTTYLIDREGWIAKTFTGGTSEETFRDALEALL